jgi:hypothetical protein
MYGKKYVVVTDAQRLFIDIDIGNPRVKSHIYEHRKGEFGMIHPYIADFYKKLKSNIRKYSDDGKLKTFPASEENSLEELFYRPHPEDIPVLMYNWKKAVVEQKVIHNFTAFEPRYDSEMRKPEFFIAMLRPGEYETIKKKRFNDVVNGALEICIRNDINIYKDFEKNAKLGDVLGMQLEKFRKFSEGTKEELYEKIANKVHLEVALFKMRKDELQRKLEATRKFSDRTKVSRLHR